jgi:hypothetical protein
MRFIVDIRQRFHETTNATEGHLLTAEPLAFGEHDIKLFIFSHDIKYPASYYFVIRKNITK